MRGIRRAKGIAPNGKNPILTSLLRQLLEALPDDLSGLRDKAILLIGFAGAFRCNEIVGLQVRDVQISDAGLIVTLRRSKTDQEGASFTKGIPIGTSDATCPKYALEAWMQLAGITSGPIFRPVDRWGHIGTRALSSLGVDRTHDRRFKRPTGIGFSNRGTKTIFHPKGKNPHSMFRIVRTFCIVDASLGGQLVLNLG